MSMPMPITMPIRQNWIKNVVAGIEPAPGRVWTATGEAQPSPHFNAGTAAHPLPSEC